MSVLPQKPVSARLGAVIHDVDASLLALIRRDAIDGSGVEVSFEAPTRDWAARRNTPTVDLYLYDIREDLERLQAGWQEVRDETGKITERRPPRKRYRLSYIVTAWTKRPDDEHRLLSALLGCFAGADQLPNDVLAGGLAAEPLGVYLTVALPPRDDRSISDIWTALGGELKPSLDVVVNAPLPPVAVEPVGAWVTEKPRPHVGQIIRRPEPVGRRRRGQGGDAEADDAVEETVVGGLDGTGRNIRIRGSVRR